MAALLLLTFLALLVHGYHLGIEDQAIYLPGILRNLDSGLFVRDAEMFLPQTRPMLFGELIAFSVRITHVPLDGTIFLWQLLSIFLVLLGARRLAQRCFPSAAAQWAGISMLAVFFTLPVTGTGLYIVDQYLHPRTLATAFLLFMLMETLERRFFRAALWLIPAALMHIQMAFYGALLGVFFSVPENWFSRRPRSSRTQSTAVAMLLFPLASLFERGSPAWLEAARTRSIHYLLRWPWYEWLGIFAPLALLLWFGKIAGHKQWRQLRFASRRLAGFGACIFMVAAALTIPPQWERLTPYQPMRGFHLVYLIFALFAGGMLGEFFLKKKVLRWILVFVPLGLGMFYAQRQLFASSLHIEFPGRAPQNDWVRAFTWIQQNTPADAYFALDPYYMARPGEDEHGFRALADRSMMADYLKDSGVALLFPAIAERWQKEVHAREGWRSFRRPDFERLHHDFGVNWVVLENSQPGVGDLRCLYQNKSVRVCRVE